MIGVAVVALLTAMLVVVSQPWVSATRSSGERTVLVPMTPCRLIDTRATGQIGPHSTLGAGSTITVAARGTNGQCTIPLDAAAISTNMTAIGATTVTYLTVWPGGAMPLASSLNPEPGQPPTPNAVTTNLSSSGDFRIYNFAGTVDLVVDVDGYYAHHDHDDRYDTSAEVDAKIAAIPTGPTGPQGLPGPKGDQGDPGAPAPRPERVVWVAESGGDYELLSEALGAIGTTLPAATEAAPYLVKVGPGAFTETDPVVLEDHVDIEGSGRHATTILCNCGGSTADAGSAAVVVDGATTSEVRHLSISNEGGGTYSYGFHATDATEWTSLVHVSINATGSTNNTGVFNDNSGLSMDHLVVGANGGTNATGIENTNGSYPTITNTWVDAFSTSSTGTGVVNTSSEPVMRGMYISVRDNNANIGVDNTDSGSPRLTSSNIYLAGGSGCEGIVNDNSFGRIEHVSITVDSTGTSTGILNIQDSGPTIEDLSITAFSSTSSSYTAFTGVSNTSSYPVIHGLTIVGEAGGANTGVYNVGAGPDITDATIRLMADASGSNKGIHSINNLTTRSGARVTGLVVSVNGGATNTGVVETNSDARMNSVEIHASGTGTNKGMEISGSNPELHTVWIDVSGSGGNNTGILNQSSSQTIIDDVHAFVEGDANDHNVVNNASTIQIRNGNLGGTSAGSDPINNVGATSVAFVANTIMNKAPGGYAGSYHNPYGNVLPDFTPITVYP